MKALGFVRWLALIVFGCDLFSFNRGGYALFFFLQYFLLLKVHLQGTSRNLRHIFPFICLD
jgi:hypothetical protein